jgi:hypothetical protein
VDIIGHSLKMRQGSYQAMGSWQNSCCGVGRKKNRKADKWGMERRKKGRRRLDFEL